MYESKNYFVDNLQMIYKWYIHKSTNLVYL